MGAEDIISQIIAPEYALISLMLGYALVYFLKKWDKIKYAENEFLDKTIIGLGLGIGIFYSLNFSWRGIFTNLFQWWGGPDIYPIDSFTGNFVSGIMLIALVGLVITRNSKDRSEGLAKFLALGMLYGAATASFVVTIYTIIEIFRSSVPLELITYIAFLGLGLVNSYAVFRILTPTWRFGKEIWDISSFTTVAILFLIVVSVPFYIFFPFQKIELQTTKNHFQEIKLTGPWQNCLDMDCIEKIQKYEKIHKEGNFTTDKKHPWQYIELEDRPNLDYAPLEITISQDKKIILETIRFRKNKDRQEIKNLNITYLEVNSKQYLIITQNKIEEHNYSIQITGYKQTNQSFPKIEYREEDSSETEIERTLIVNNDNYEDMEILYENVKLPARTTLQCPSTLTVKYQFFDNTMKNTSPEGCYKISENVQEECYQHSLRSNIPAMQATSGGQVLLNQIIIPKNSRLVAKINVSCSE